MRGNAGAITTITTIRRGKSSVASGKSAYWELGTVDHQHALFSTNTTNTTNTTNEGKRWCNQHHQQGQVE
jgi:hypothetical protein